MASSDTPLERIAIIGNAGGGKSVLARGLGRALALPVHTIDDVQWQPGWTPAPASLVAEQHAAWLAKDGWIIDGWGDWTLIEARFTAADAIVVVDFPFHVHVRWALKRQAEVMLGIRRDWPPAGCSALPITWRLLRLMWYVHRQARPTLLALADEDRFRHRVVYLRSPRALRRWRASASARRR